MKKLQVLISCLIFLLGMIVPASSQNNKAMQERVYSKDLNYELVKMVSLGSGASTLFGNTRSGDQGGYDVFIQNIDSNLATINESYFGSDADEYVFNAFRLQNGKIGFYGKKEAIVNNTSRWSIFFHSMEPGSKKKSYQEYPAFKNDSLAQHVELEQGDIVLIGNKEDWGDRDQNIWLVCLNKKGVLRWQVNIGERYIDEIGLDIIKDGNSYYILAEKREKGTITPMILKTDLHGNLQWEKEIPGMKNYNAERFFLSHTNRFVVFGSINSAGNHAFSAFQLDLSIRSVSKTFIGHQDPGAHISFTAGEQSIWMLLNHSNQGRIYRYDHRADKVYTANIMHSNKMNFVDLMMDENSFVVAGNQVSDRKNSFYIQKNQPDFNAASDMTETMSGGLDRAKKESTKIEILEPANKMGFARLTNMGSVDLKVMIESDKIISEVLVNGTRMTKIGEHTYTTKVALKEGFNQCKFKTVHHDGSHFMQLLVIENTLGTKPPEGLAKGKNYALIMAVNEYNDPAITDLDNPYIDGSTLMNTLHSLYTFERENTYFLVNPTREEIITKFDELVYEIKEEDNLLVFYAGHGYWDKKTNIGYWLPSDSKQSNTANWLSNSTIKDFISAIPSKHTLLVADACFSGGIFKTRKAFNDNISSVDKLYKLPSRKAMTSGTLKEVPDKSVFLQYLIKRLKENDQKYISSEALFSSMRTAVLNNSSNVPQYGEIKDAGDEGGDFIFIRRDGE